MATSRLRATVNTAITRLVDKAFMAPASGRNTLVQNAKPQRTGSLAGKYQASVTVQISILSSGPKTATASRPISKARSMPPKISGKRDCGSE